MKSMLQAQLMTNISCFEQTACHMSRECLGISWNRKRERFLSKASAGC